MKYYMHFHATRGLAARATLSGATLSIFSPPAKLADKARRRKLERASKRERARRAAIIFAARNRCKFIFLRIVFEPGAAGGATSRTFARLVGEAKSGGRNEFSQTARRSGFGASFR
jgi:hypothetical protein